SATLTSRLASARAVASPRPDAPPVTIADMEEFRSMTCPLISFPGVSNPPHPPRKGPPSGQHHLRLGHNGHQLSVFTGDAGLPDRASSPDMDRRRFREDGRALLRSADE